MRLRRFTLPVGLLALIGGITLLAGKASAASWSVAPPAAALGG